MLETINLSRFNTRFQQEANRHQPWRLYAYPILQEAGTSLSFSNTLIDLRQRAKGLTNIDHISRGAQKAGLKLAIAGSAINGTSSALELAQNAWVMWRAGEMGFSPRKSADFVRTAMHKIEILLAERQSLVTQETSPSNRELLELEGRLMDHIKNQLVYEFRKVSSRSREVAWRENTFFAVDTGRNFTTCASGILSLNAFYHRPYIRGTSAICSLTADTMAMLNPPFRTAAGLCARKYQRHQLLKYFPMQAPALANNFLADTHDLDEYRAKLDQSAPDQRSLEEAAFLFQRAEAMSNGLAATTDRIEKLRRVAGQQAISGPIIGLASVARSVLLTVAYYGYHDKREIINRLSFAGRISQACGQTYSLFATPKAQIQGFINRRRLAKKGQLPEQILAGRIIKMDLLKARIESEHPQ
jgi:hypothetical protein